MAQTSCQLASGYPRAGRNIPGLPHHTLDRQAPTTITARDFDHFMRVPPNGTLQRGNSQAARLHRRSRSRAGPPRNCFREAGTMLLFPGRGLENYDASIIRPGCGGRHVCWPMRAAGSRQLQHRSSTRTERPALPSFTNSIRRHRETEYTTRSTLHLSGRHRYAQAYNNGKAAPASVSPPMAVHYTVIYGPDVCLTLFDAMQMAPGRGQKTAPTTSWHRWDNFAAVFCTKLQPKTLLSVPKAELSENEATMNSNRLYQAAQDASLSLLHNALRSSPLLAILTCQAR